MSKYCNRCGLSITGLVEEDDAGSFHPECISITLSYKPSPELLSNIERSFTYHKPHEDQPLRYAMLRAKAKELALLIAHLVPHCREKDLALQNLKMSVACANMGIACGECEPT